MTVEFFLVVPLIFLVLVAGVQVASVARTRIELLGAAREGARVAATTPDPAKAVEAVRDALPHGQRDRARISVSRPGAVGKPAKVSVSVNHQLFGVLLGGFSVEVTASASMYVER